MSTSQKADESNLFNGIFPVEEKTIWLALYGWPGSVLNVQGQDGALGLRLIGSCLESRYGYQTRDPNVDFEGIPLHIEPSHQHWLGVMRSADILLRQSGLSYIWLAHLMGSQLWEMSWSDDLTEDEMWEEIMTFVRCGMCFDF